MKQIFMIMCCLLPVSLFAQLKVEKPFHYFENWKDVLSEAQAKNKRIFIDAYATWCGPCKQMDKEVFPNTNIVNYIDSNFIAVKVQMDQTKADLPDVKNWYADAKMIMEKYNIQAFPCFIFLDINGDLIQIIKGYQPVNTFLSSLKDANNPENSFSNQITHYKNGDICKRDLLELALKAKEYKNDSLALEIARTYKTTYLDKQKLENILNPSLIQLLGNFDKVMLLTDRIVKYSYQRPKIVDSLIQRKGIALAIVDFYIDRDMIQPMLDAQTKLRSSSEPDWKMMHSTLKQKFDRKTADRIIVNQQIGFYRKTKNWEKLAKYEINKIEMFGLDTVGIGKTMINNLMFDLFFKYIDNPVYLEKAVGYMDVILASDPNQDAWIDTYANLLFKTGNKNKALNYEEKALNIAKDKEYKAGIKEYSENLEKMRANQPTWTAVSH